MWQPRCANSSSSIRARCTAAAEPGGNLHLNQAYADTTDCVTTSVTLHYLCHSVSQGDQEELQQLQHAAVWLKPTPAQENLTTNTHSHITPSEVTTGVHMASMHTHREPMQKPLCPHLSAVRTVSNTHTGACTLHPCSIQPPTLLKAAALGACACESGCGLSSPHRCTPSALASEGNEGFRSSL